MSGESAQLPNAVPPEPVTLDIAQLESFKCFTVHKCLNCGSLITVPSFKIPSNLLHFDPRMPAPQHAIAYMPNEQYFCPLCGNILAIAHFVQLNASVIAPKQPIRNGESSNDVS